MLKVLAELAKGPLNNHPNKTKGETKGKTKQENKTKTKQTDNKKKNESGPTKNKDGQIEPPEWWVKLSPAGRDTYLRTYPHSKMTPFLRQELKNRLKENPQEREHLRNSIKKIAKNPEEALKPDLDKLDEAKHKKISDKDAEDIDNDIEEADHNPKAILHAAAKTLAVAGVLTVGAGIVAAGGLPFVLIAIHLARDAKELHHDVKRLKEKGDTSYQAMLEALKRTISKSARDPDALADAVSLDQEKQHAEHKDAEKEDDADENDVGENDHKYDEHFDENDNYIPKDKRKKKAKSSKDDENEDDNKKTKKTSNKRATSKQADKTGKLKDVKDKKKDDEEEQPAKPKRPHISP